MLLARGTFMATLHTRAEIRRLTEDVMADRFKTGPTQKELDDTDHDISSIYTMYATIKVDIVRYLGDMHPYDLPLRNL